MGPFLAIIADTWRQSKQQLVFLLLIGTMVLFSVGWVLLCKVSVTKDGTYVLTVAFAENPEAGFEAAWDGAYKEKLIGDEGRRKLWGPRVEAQRALADYRRAERKLAVARLNEASPEAKQPIEAEFAAAQKVLEEKGKAFEELQKQVDEAAQKQVDERSPGITALDKGVQVWMSNGVSLLVYITMFGFIAACAGYFPAMLAAGAVDILVSKPVSRAEIFFGKYLGGLVLFSGALFLSCVVMFAGLGFKTGVWHFQFFAAMPVIVFSAALLYAIVAWIGVFTRSMPLAIIVGYIYYVILEIFIWVMQQADQWLAELGTSNAWVTTISTGSRWAFPGFGRLNGAAMAAVMDVPVFDGQPLLVGAVWLALLLGSAFWYFRRMDF